MFLNDAKQELQKTFDLEWRTVQKKNNFLPQCLETSFAWNFLFLCSFLNNYPWTFEKKLFFNKL